MSSRKAKLLSMVAVAGAVAFISASAQAQYATRYHRYPYNARAQALYNAQAYVGGDITVLPPTIVGGLGQSFYDPYGNLPAVYGCCWTTNNEQVGLVGAGNEGGSGGSLGR
jgi:hypothetical protein